MFSRADTLDNKNTAYSVILTITMVTCLVGLIPLFCWKCKCFCCRRGCPCCPDKKDYPAEVIDESAI